MRLMQYVHVDMVVASNARELRAIAKNLDGKTRKCGGSEDSGQSPKTYDEENEKPRLGGAGHRSPYLSHAKRALYHLSYTPMKTWRTCSIVLPIIGGAATARSQNCVLHRMVTKASR